MPTIDNSFLLGAIQNVVPFSLSYNKWPDSIEESRSNFIYNSISY